MGEYLSGGEYRRFDMRISEDGVAWGHSPILGLDLHWGEIRLHYFDPVEGEWLLGLREEQAARREEQAARREEQAARREEQAARREEQAALREEQRAHRETRRRLRQLEEELRRREQP